MENKVFSQEKTSITRVVIDAGHGGKDPGTIGKKSQEKEVALQIALKLSEEIRSQCKDVTVICTRTTDEFIELHERAEIANRSKADLFISIHCNANPKHTFQGAETYVMGLHRTEANLEIAKKENAAILMEPDYSTNYNGFDPNSDESYITFTLFQNAFLEQSTWFASLVQDEMKDRVGMYDRGVRQAGFLVLYKTTMPSVLVETGFLSNPEEEKFLMSQKGQQYISSAIFRAFRKFKAKMEGNGKELASLNEKKSYPENTTVTQPVEKKVSAPAEEKPKQVILTKDTAKPKEKPKVTPAQTISEKPREKPKEKPKETLPKKDTVKTRETQKEKPKETLPQKDTVKTRGKPGANLPRKETVKQKEKQKQPSARGDSVKSKEKSKVPTAGKAVTQKKKKPGENPPAKDTLKTKPKERAHPVKKDSISPKENLATKAIRHDNAKEKPAVKNPVKAEEVKKTPAKQVDEVVFRVQIVTSAKELSTHSKKFAGLQDIWRYQHQGSFKYTTGKESSPEALAGLLGEVKKMGFTDAFIVAFHGKERITVAEAKKLISEKK
jgi:N-acetylmuramoyl-L-alanine amidase